MIIESDVVWKEGIVKALKVGDNYVYMHGLPA
jgi:hypothetical protein